MDWRRLLNVEKPSERIFIRRVHSGFFSQEFEASGDNGRTWTRMGKFKNSGTALVWMRRMFPAHSIECWRPENSRAK